MKFDELIENEMDSLESIDDYLDDFMLESFSDEEIEEIREELGIDSDQLDENDLERIEEQLRRRVTSTGNISRVQSRKVRSRRATATTGLSKSALRLRARKAAKTKKRKPGDTKKALRKRARALRKRKQLGLKANR